MGLLILCCVCAVFLLSLLVLCKVYAIVTLGRCRGKNKLFGKTVLVTGSNRGIGYITALNLAKRGARVIITSENGEDLYRAREQMVYESGNKNIVAKHLDFLSLENVRNFAKDILNTEERLDVLINNAGVIGLRKTYTKDGLLAGMQVNYFGPFLLTHLLLGLLKKSGKSRIVNVASVLSQLTIGFVIEDINSVAFASNILYETCVYSNSKYCVALSTTELANKLKNTEVTVNCLHPGAVQTKIFNELKIAFFVKLYHFMRYLFFKTPEEGADTSTHLAACESVEGITGKYFSDCRQSWFWANMSEKNRKKVWEQTVKLVKLRPEEIHY